jgi:hypothetical protein
MSKPKGLKPGQPAPVPREPSSALGQETLGAVAKRLRRLEYSQVILT